MTKVVGLAVFALVLITASACSSDDEPDCRIEGTYTMTATPETQSEGCSAVPPSSSTTITISPFQGAYAVELQGGTGACRGDRIEACKLQTKCDVNVVDATDPAQRTGTLQFSWTFSQDGFTGLNAGSVPPATSVPKGCTFSSNATAKRR